MARRLGSFLDARGRWVLAAAAILAVVAGAFGAGATGRLTPYSASDPGSPSVRAYERYQRATGRQLDPGLVALVDAGSLATPAGFARIAAVETRLARQPEVVRVLSWYETHDPAMVSRSGRETYVVAYFHARSDLRLSAVTKRIQRDLGTLPSVKLGGPAIANAEANTQVSADLARSELLAFPLIFLLSLLFFRSLVAALLPPLLGGLTIVVTLLALRIASSFTDVSVYAVNFVTGLGLGLAIDYSLFVVSRCREEAATHGFGTEALARTLHSAGRTVLFSSLTVAAAIASLLVFPQNFLHSMGIGGTVGVLLAGAGALLVLPALLAVLGPRIDALAPARLARAAQRDARPARSGGWYTLAQFVMRHAAPVAVLVTGCLVALGLPFLGVRFISVGASSLPPSFSARQVDQVLRTRFPPGRTTPLELVAAQPASSSALRTFSRRLAALPDVAAVAPAQPAGAQLALIDVAPASPTLSAASQALVHRIRRLRTPYYVGVSGETAGFVDLKASLAEHLPVVLTLIAAATVIVLFLMTGSVLLPLKAIVMNALSLSAVFGILVLVFQDGRLQGLLGFRSLGALDATQPIFLMAVAFGLATDYGVFLLSRIKEAHDAGAGNTAAVAGGLERTGRIVTAAAVLFAVAIGAFASSSLVFIKELGLGTALAVLIDASVIRALLVPSLMKLLGEWNWWAPKPLRRLHERFGLGEEPEPAAGRV